MVSDIASTDPQPTRPRGDDLAFAGVARQAELVRAGEVSARELVELHLARIDRLDGVLHAFRSVAAERALAEADAAQERLRDGDPAPLLGVPIAVKDNVDVAGETTAHGTPESGPPARADAEVVRRLRVAGAVVVGRTAMPELALWPHFTESRTGGVTRNPWDPERTPGGSSGGAAAAVAAGLAAGAVGSDGGGSIRVPAACCGLFGLKPQRGRISLMPLAEHWLGLTHLGPLARRVLDAAVLLDALHGPAPGDADRPPAPAQAFARAAATAPGTLRIAVSTKPAMPTRVAPAIREAVESTAELLRSLGHEVRERDPDYGVLMPQFLPRYARGAWEDAQELPSGPRLERRTRGMVRLGAAMARPAARVRAAEPARAARIGAIFADHDVVLTPTIAAAPPRAGRHARAGALRTFLDAGTYACFTAPWNITGQPAASVPAGFDADGLPLAVQLVARPGAEATLLALAAQLEQARPWAGRRPSEP
jgi:amidase